MSRSYKKNPAGGNCGGSDKYSKRVANKTFRICNNTLLRKMVEDFEPKIMGEMGNTDSWVFHKDGKGWYGIPSPEGGYWTVEEIKKYIRK